MKKFTILQRIRNKIKLKKKLIIDIDKQSKIVGCTIYNNGEGNKLIIGNKTILRNVNIEFIGDNNELFIGKNCMIGDNCYLSIKENTNLIIDDNCGLSRNVKIMTSDGHSIFQNGKRINFSKNILINKNVWIADNVTILKGVEIGENSVVGINSTLTKSIPIGSISVGNPAKVVKENITWKA